MPETKGFRAADLLAVRRSDDPSCPRPLGARQIVVRRARPTTSSLRCTSQRCLQTGPKALLPDVTGCWVVRVNLAARCPKTVLFLASGGEAGASSVLLAARGVRAGREIGLQKLAGSPAFRTVRTEGSGCRWCGRGVSIARAENN